MGNVKNLSVVSSGDSPLADVMSNNFDRCAEAVNSNALNSNNYGLGNIGSNNIANNAIRNAHLVNSQIQSQHIADEAILENSVRYDRVNAGVRVARVGSVSSDMPANGVGIVRISRTIEATATNDTYVVVWSDAMDGYNSFTATPYVVGEPFFKFAATSDHGPYQHYISDIDSSGMTIRLAFSATADTQTMYVVAAGAVSE